MTVRRVVPSLAVALALSLGAGCAGDRNSGRTDGAVRIDTAQKDGPAGGGDSTVDSAPDTITPDTGPQPGGPCPCSGGLICALGACRTPCTDADCNEGGPCAASEACIPVGNAAACLPAA